MSDFSTFMVMFECGLEKQSLSDKGYIAMSLPADAGESPCQSASMYICVG